MQIPEIIEIKDHFDQMKNSGLIKEWNLPYEDLLTRRSAAIFFFSTSDESKLNEIRQELQQYEHFSYRSNEKKQLSSLNYRATFSQEEKEKNEQHNIDAAQN